MLKRFALTVLEFFLPRMCLFCGAGVGEEAAAGGLPGVRGADRVGEQPLVSLLRADVCLPGRRRPALRRLPDGAAAL